MNYKKAKMKYKDAKRFLTEQECFIEEKFKFPKGTIMKIVKTAIAGGAIGWLLGTFVKDPKHIAAIAGVGGLMYVIVSSYIAWSKEECSKYYFKSCKDYYKCLVKISERLIKKIEINKKKFKQAGKIKEAKRCEILIKRVREVVEQRKNKLAKCKD